LELREGPAVDDAFVEALVAGCPRLTKLTLSWGRFTDAALDALSELDDVRSLVLTDNRHVTASAAVALLERATAAAWPLEKFGLRDCDSVDLDEVEAALAAFARDRGLQLIRAPRGLYKFQPVRAFDLYAHDERAKATGRILYHALRKKWDKMPLETRAPYEAEAAAVRGRVAAERAAYRGVFDPDS